MKSFVIYNPDDEVSRSLLSQTVNSCRIFGIDPEPFVGTFREQIDFKLKKYNLGVSPIVPKMTQGTKGCFVSHYELWKKSVEIDQPLLILEHDVVMINKIPDNVFNQFNDILNLDSCGSNQKDLKKYLDCVNKVHHTTVIASLDQRNKETMSWKSVKQNNVSGAYAYIIKPQGAKKLIKAAEKNGFLPVDVHINSYYLSLNIIRPSMFRICDFMIDRKNRIKFSSTKGYLNG